jgi:hypothetical protein
MTSHYKQPNTRTKRKTTITFSIDDDILKVIRKESQDDEISLNSRINTILGKYINFYKRIEDVGAQVISHKTFHFRLENIDEEKYTDHLYESLSELFPLYLYEKELPVTFENFVEYFLPDIGVNSGSFDSVLYSKDSEGHPRVLLRHRHGMKWSRILCNATVRRLETVFNYHTSAKIEASSILITILEKALP